MLMVMDESGASYEYSRVYGSYYGPIKRYPYRILGPSSTLPVSRQDTDDTLTTYRLSQKRQVDSSTKVISLSNDSSLAVQDAPLEQETFNRSTSSVGIEPVRRYHYRLQEQSSTPSPLHGLPEQSSTTSPLPSNPGYVNGIYELYNQYRYANPNPPNQSADRNFTGFSNKYVVNTGASEHLSTGPDSHGTKVPEDTKSSSPLIFIASRGK